MALNQISLQSSQEIDDEKRLEMEYAESAEQDRIICAEFDGTLMDGLESESW